MGKSLRKEKDSLGEFAVPSFAYWGANTGRAVRNFPISGFVAHPGIVESLCKIKKAAARVNLETGLLPKKKARAIIKAADEALAGKFKDQFVVDRFQAGAGTSTNMNVNEVLCNRALEFLGREKGDYRYLSPNDDVNMSQSTNDVYPTAMRLSALYSFQRFKPRMEALIQAFLRLGRQYASVLKSGRTHLQDAVPVTIGGEFLAYADGLRLGLRHLERTAQDLRELGIGGSAVGTGMNTHPQYAGKMVRELSRLTGLKLKRSKNLMEAMQSQAVMARTSSALKDLALDLIRIANDLRLLSSGPTTGLAEIILPAVQAGSSIMPGKVNPSILEMVNMVCFRVVGNDLGISMAVSAGQLELNVMMPLMAENLLESFDILTSAVTQMDNRCVSGIQVDKKKCAEYAERSLGLATALSPGIGYLAAAGIAKKASAEKKTIVRVLEETGSFSKKEIKRLLDPGRMTRPHLIRKKK